MEDRGVGVSHQDSRRSDRGGADGAVCWNALRRTGEFRRRPFHRAGLTVEQPPQAREKTRAVLLGCFRPVLRRGSNGTGNNIRSGFHDRQRIGGGSTAGRHEQHKRIHGCFFLETKLTVQGGMTERGRSHPTSGTRGREAPLRAHRPLAAELGVSIGQRLDLASGQLLRGMMDPWHR